MFLRLLYDDFPTMSVGILAVNYMDYGLAILELKLIKVIYLYKSLNTI